MPYFICVGTISSLRDLRFVDPGSTLIHMVHVSRPCNSAQL